MHGHQETHILKKKIFFLLHSMNVGGVEKAMLGLLSVLPLNQYEVHLGLLHKKGGFLNDIPTQVSVHEIPCYDKYWELINDPPLQNIKQMVSQGHFLDALIHFFLYVHFKLTSNRYWFYRYIMKSEPKFPMAFDLAVSFAGPSQMMDYYICQQVDAKIKCGWIHFDVSKFGIDEGMTRQLYKQYKRIFIVSETAKNIFDSIFPEFQENTVVFHNVVSPSQIVTLARDGSTFDDGFTGKRILTVGRIAQEKGQRTAIQALKLLSDKYSHLRWYFIGGGSDMVNCQDEAKKLGIAEQVVFLGANTNPYAYMRDCDIYVQPSRHEGFCITLAEALCFGNPIVATDFTGAQEQLKERENGFVVGMGAEAIASGIEKALTAPKTEKVREMENSDVEKLLSLLIECCPIDEKKYIIPYRIPVRRWG